MKDLYIVIEGDADLVFLGQLIKSHFPARLDAFEFIKAETNGESIKRKKIDQIVNKTIRLQYQTIFILDADAPNLHDTRQNLIDNFRAEDILIPETQIFLLPDNKNDGCLEHLLLEIVADKAAEIFDCFEAYKACIHQINEVYTKPDLKTKVYAYSEITTGSGKEKERDYLNHEVWNLNHSALNPLVDFLKNYLS